MLLPALPAETEAHARASYDDMLVAQRREAVAAVLFRVFLVADANERDLEQPDDRGDDLVSGDLAAAQIAVDALPYLRQGIREIKDAFVLRLFADLTEAVVIAVLLATLRIATRRLQMPARVRGDPDVAPGGWDRKTAHATKIVLVLQ